MKNLAEKVRQYINRAKKEEKLTSYPLEKEDDYVITSGITDEWGHRNKIGIYHGRFIDVVAKAVSQSGFYGWYCGSENADNPNHGYVTALKPEPEKIEQVGKIDKLVTYVRTVNTSLKKQSELESQIAKIEYEIDKKRRTQ